MEYKPEPAPCCYSTTEGEPELYPSEGGTAVCTRTLGQNNHSTLPVTSLHLYTGAVMRDLTVEAMPDSTDQHSNDCQGKHPASFIQSSQGEDHTTPPLCLHSCLPSKCAYHIILTKALCTCQLTKVQDPHSLLKTALGSIRDWYQAYCTTYKTHTMATCHRGVGHPLDRSLDILTEDPEHTDINNDSTHSSDATVAPGGPEAVGHPEDPVYNNQDGLMALTRRNK